VVTLKKKIGCLVLVLVVAALAVWVNWRPPSFPQEAKQALDESVRHFKSPSFDYNIVSAEKGATVNPNNTDKLEAAPFGLARRPAGVCPPDSPQAQENWCVIVDRQVETSAGTTSTHFIVQRQGQLWMVEEVPDSDAEVFGQFGCRKW